MKCDDVVRRRRIGGGGVGEICWRRVGGKDLQATCRYITYLFTTYAEALEDLFSIPGFIEIPRGISISYPGADLPFSYCVV